MQNSFVLCKLPQALFNRMKKTAYYVYILKCADSSLYTGIATDVKRRVEEHNHSKLGAKYTKGRTPVELVYEEKFKNRSEASKREYEIKLMSRQAKELLLNIRPV